MSSASDGRVPWISTVAIYLRRSILGDDANEPPMSSGMTTCCLVCEAGTVSPSAVHSPRGTVPIGRNDRKARLA